MTALGIGLIAIGAALVFSALVLRPNRSGEAEDETRDEEAPKVRQRYRPVNDDVASK